MKSNSSPMDKISQLKLFFNQLRKKTIFTSKDISYYQKLRKQIKTTIFTLLTENRDYLSESKGLDWIYDELKECEPYFKYISHHGETNLIKEQAKLFLCLLPFPKQWRRLLQFEEEFQNNAEILELISEEKNKVQAKLGKKKQKRFKLHHFCQILKKPKLPSEKGILRIFSLPYLFANSSLLYELNKEYFLYIEPPWGVLARHYWLRLFSDLDDPCLFGVGGHEDTLYLQTQSNIITTHLAHGDFLNESELVLLDREKSYDLVFNALYDDMSRKRHEFLLDTLLNPLLRKVNVLFIGRGERHNVEKLVKKVRDRGLEKRVTVFSNIQRKKVPDLLACCRIGIQVSSHENVCRSIYEYFRSNLPCVVTDSMAGLNFDIINSKTGVISNDSNLPDTILYILKKRDQFRPRDWFLENSGSTNSTKMLNRQFKNIFKKLGYQWSEDIIPLDSSGANRYTTSDNFKYFQSEFESLFDIFQKHASMKIKLLKP